MKYTVLATYERKSTLWKNANARYHMQNWCKMECIKADYTDDINAYEEIGVRWIDKDGNDKTEEQIKKLYIDKKYCVQLTNARGTNSKCFWFKTKEEANSFFKEMLSHKVFNGWHKTR